MIDPIAVPLIATALASPASATTAPPLWPDTPLARVEALALLQTLNADLLSHDSATLTLDAWCQRHRLAAPGEKIVAERLRDIDKPVTPEQRALLGVGADEPVRYRHVRLRCGGHMLSEADNWYVPARLTPTMNAALDNSDIAFGRAVQALHFHRHTLSAQLLWSPLPADWDSAPAPLAAATLPSARALAIPARLIEHRAILSLPNGAPFSIVVETYTGAVLAFPPPIGER
jgi:chorismate-pyruvate lyase